MDQELMSYSELVKSKVPGCVCEPYPAAPDQQIMATKHFEKTKHTLILQRGQSPQAVTQHVDEWIAHLERVQIH